MVLPLLCRRCKRQSGSERIRWNRKKSETEKLLRQAMDDYESKKFIAKSENITIGELLDIWAEEELKTGTLSNGTVQNYLGAITNIKKHPNSERKNESNLCCNLFFLNHLDKCHQSNISLSIRCSILS